MEFIFLTCGVKGFARVVYAKKETATRTATIKCTVYSFTPDIKSSKESLKDFKNPPLSKSVAINAINVFSMYVKKHKIHTLCKIKILLTARNTETINDIAPSAEI